MGVEPTKQNIQLAAKSTSQLRTGLNLEIISYRQREKPEYPEKNPLSQFEIIQISANVQALESNLSQCGCRARSLNIANLATAKILFYIVIHSMFLSTEEGAVLRKRFRVKL